MKKTLKALSTSIMAALLLSAIGTTEIAYALNSTSSEEVAFLTGASDEMKNINTEDEALPFTEKPDGHFSGNRIVVMFKYDYSEEYIENVIKPELIKLAGKEQFSELKFIMNCNCEDQANRLIYCITFNFDDKEKIYNTAVDFYNTGYFYSVEMDYIPIPAADDADENVTEDEALPFTEKPNGDFTGNKIVVMFKYDYSEEYIENVIKPELIKLAGEEQFSELKFIMNCNCEDQANRLIYCITFNFDDKEKIYNTAVDFYNTGYFYSVEMNYIPIPANDDTTLIPDGKAYGDVNNDSIVNISDIVALNLYLLNKEKYPLSKEGIANADCLKDNVIDAKDATLLMNYIAEIIEKSSLGKAI